MSEFETAWVSVTKRRGYHYRHVLGHWTLCFVSCHVLELKILGFQPQNPLGKQTSFLHVFQWWRGTRDSKWSNKFGVRFSQPRSFKIQDFSQPWPGISIWTSANLARPDGWGLFIWDEKFWCKLIYHLKKDVAAQLVYAKATSLTNFGYFRYMWIPTL